MQTNNIKFFFIIFILLYCPKIAAIATQQLANLNQNLQSLSSRYYKYTATEAYLSAKFDKPINFGFGNFASTVELVDSFYRNFLSDHNPHNHESIISNSRGPLNKYKNIIDQALNKESEFKETHYVFYLSQDYRLRIVQDLQKELCIIQKKCSDNLDFIFFKPYITNHLVTNLSLFGNTGNQNTNTFSNFIKPKIENINFGKLINELITPYLKNIEQKAHITIVLSLLAQDTVADSHIDLSDPKDFISSINTNDTIYTPEAQLIQIFIPKNLIDALVNIENYKTDQVINTYLNNPEKLNLEVNTLTAKINIDNKDFADPAKNIKMFLYTTLDSKREGDYQTRIKSIAKYILDQARLCT